MSDYYCTSGGCNPCKPTPPPPQQQVQGVTQEHTECNCRASMVQALQMLLRSGLSGLVDFSGFAFVTDTFLVGANLSQPAAGAATFDNLADTLTGTFSGFTPCACDYIDVAGAAYGPTVAPTTAECLTAILTALTANADTAASTELATLVTALTALTAQITPTDADFNAPLATALDTALTCATDTGLTISRISLCALRAVAFGPMGDTEAAEAANYQSARQLLNQIMRPQCRDACPPYPDPCTEPCCPQYSDGITIGRTVSLTAGNLTVAGVTVLGRIGEVIVLANDTDRRFYFVCADAAQLIR